MIFDMGLDDQANTSATGTWVGPAADALVTSLRTRIVPGRDPSFVGIDGRSGSGKSTLAAAVAHILGGAGRDAAPVTVIEGDQFYAGGSAEVWDRRTAAERADRVIDWRRQRDILQQLRTQGVAEWHPFD